MMMFVLRKEVSRVDLNRVIVIKGYRARSAI
jgi:hypothetical protein